jgi:hypothetical protein
VTAAATPHEAIDLARDRLEAAGIHVAPDTVVHARIVARQLHEAVRGATP